MDTTSVVSSRSFAAIAQSSSPPSSCHSIPFFTEEALQRLGASIPAQSHSPCLEGSVSSIQLDITVHGQVQGNHTADLRILVSFSINKKCEGSATVRIGKPTLKRQPTGNFCEIHSGDLFHGSKDLSAIVLSGILWLLGQTVNVREHPVLLCCRHVMATGRSFIHAALFRELAIGHINMRDLVRYLSSSNQAQCVRLNERSDPSEQKSFNSLLFRAKCPLKPYCPSSDNANGWMSIRLSSTGKIEVMNLKGPSSSFPSLLRFARAFVEDLIRGYVAADAACLESPVKKVRVAARRSCAQVGGGFECVSPPPATWAAFRTDVDVADESQQDGPSSVYATETVECLLDGHEFCNDGENVYGFECW